MQCSKSKGDSKGSIDRPPTHTKLSLSGCLTDQQIWFPVDFQITTPAPHDSVFYRPDALPLTLLVQRHEAHLTCKKLERWGAGVVICLQRGADLHMAHLMPLPLTVSCFSKIQIGFTCLFRLTWVVQDKGPLNGCVCCVCVRVCVPGVSRKHLEFTEFLNR